MAPLEKLFLVLSLHVGLVLSKYNADEEDRTLIFKEEVPNKALHGHVIRTEQVLNEGSCRLQCYLEPNCVSINVGPLTDGSYQCDLNDVTDDKEFDVALTNTTGFTYNGVENLCRKRPCWNNGTCQAGFTVEGFRCICPVGVLGGRCKQDYRVACLKGADKFSMLRDFTDKVKWGKTNEIVGMCAKLAKTNNQSNLYAMGRGGVCLSGKNMTVKYHANDTKNATCNHGIGMADSMFVYSLERLPVLQKKGCFLKVSNDSTMPNQFGNLLIERITTRLDQVLNQCARVAKDEGYKYFAIHNYGECQYGEFEGENYKRHGKISDCLEYGNKPRYGVGKEHSGFVYKIET